MAISDAVQTLSAAFAFGILLQAAAGALFIYYRGHGSTIFQDGRRLVLILFLLFAALWAQTSFLNLLLPDTMATACQATLIISTMFDQLARIGVEQFLLWSVGHGTKLTAERLILQGILLVRIGGGAALVGFTRPQFAPVCVARTSVTPVAIVVLALDAIIVGVLLVRATSLGMFSEMREKEAGTRQEQSKALIFSIIVLGLWTASSVPMILGIPSSNLMVRTVIPANGLLVMVAVVTMFPGALLLAREENATTPEAQSPFAAPMPPREVFGDTVRSNGSPVSTRTYTQDGRLFVVNPSNTPQDSSSMFQRSPRGDTRGFTKLGNEIDVREISNTPPERPDRLGVRGPGYRGSSGVFPSMVNSQAGIQGALAPQIRSDYPLPSENAVAASQFPAAQQKRSMFVWGSKQAPAKPSIRTLKISKPVALDVSGGVPQAFPNVQTIDLVTAASMERERREEAQARSRLVANRPAPQPPQFSAQEALRRSVSVKRKETPAPPVEPIPVAPANSVAGLSRVSPDGVTSSASLSPGHEEVRRRSPRQTNSFDKKLNQKALPQPTLQRKQINSFDQTFGPQAPPPPPTLQRKITIGLPSNPRSPRMMVAPETTATNAQTVMLMKNVVYDNPNLVQNIMNDAPEMYAAAQKTRDGEQPVLPQAVTVNSRDSVIHRPRPYKREKNEERALFPSMPSPSHRRSRSGGSIVPRKSLFMSKPGSPTLLPQLPPLPPPPITSAADLKRLLPNDTKSMSFNEKIELLFPAPPGSTSMHSRRSSVPSLPQGPSVFISDTPMVQSPSVEDEQFQGASKRTTIASLVIPDSPAKSARRQSRPEGYRFSADAYRTIADEVGETWIQEMSTEEFDARKSNASESRRQSIENDSRKSYSTEVSEESSPDNASTYWGSVHSKAPPVDISKLRQQASSLYIQRPDSQQQRDSTRFEPSNPLPDDLRRCEAFVPLILDAEAQRLSFTSAGKNRHSFLLDADESLPGDIETVPLRIENGWHHRIGDELPTFSERLYPKGRKMPPPTPLLLSRTGKRATVVVRPSEPSSPVDYPERAIAEIQAQLKRFEEEPRRDSVGSLLRHMPEEQAEGAPDTGRFRLLENLEKEMGQQETHWQQMQTNLDRDCISAAMSPFIQAESEDSEGPLSRQSSQRSIRTPVKLTRTRTRTRSSMTISDRIMSTSSSDNSRASIWQQRLAEAQLEYMDNAPILLKNKSLNFLAISNGKSPRGKSLRGKSPMMSPTPPESDVTETDIETEPESDSDTEAMMKYQAPIYQATPMKKFKAELWQSSLPSPKAASGRMWNPPYEKVSTSSGAEPPARGIRPAQRRMEDSLAIFSTQLWETPRSSEHSRPVVGLWGSRLVRPRSISTRPLTQRPQRRSRRMAFLPDIVESPVPLPNKRDTLGLYQFPWGETSDQPIYQPALSPMIGGQALSSNLDARSKQLEPEYPSSFFDDYEDEDEDEDFDTESDDDFDETTLWEIASLLNTTDVPSRDSLSFASSIIIDDYDLDSDIESPDSEAPAPISRISVQPLTMSSRSVAQLWGGESSPSLSSIAPGLPQPESHVWDALIPAKTDMVRSKSRSSSAIPAVSSRELWAATEILSSPTQDSFMWNSDATAVIPIASPSTSTSGSTPSASMWCPKTEASETRRSGMFTMPSEVIRSTDAVPAAFKMIKAVRPCVGEIPVILSENLWTRPQNIEEATNWISKSSVSQVAQPQTISALLWSPSPNNSDVIVPGMFDIALQRSSFRTSQASPAALYMVCKPRMTMTLMSTLSSTMLWRSGQDKFPIERDWISESSTRPESPTCSTISSGTSSPTSDSSSVKSTSTKASSIWSSPFSAIPSWWDRKAEKSPAAAPQDDSDHTSKIPVRQAPTPLVAVRESRVLASRDLWESRVQVLDNTPVKKVLRRGTRVKPSIIPVLKTCTSKHQRPVVSRADWDNALAQAIAASSVKKFWFRTAYTQADWESALSEAISQSRICIQSPAYSTAAWEAALEETVSASVAKPSYDASVLHPVFFATSLISNVSDIHPAAMGHFVFTAQPSMWTPATASTMPRPAMLWSKDNVTPRVTLSTSFSGEISRKASVARSTSIPVLESISFWQPSKLVRHDKNWLISTATTKKASISAAHTWTPTIASPVQQSATTKATMWTSLSASTHSTDIFAPPKDSYIKQVTATRPAGLACLNSNSLFDSSMQISEPATHWLHATSAPTMPSESLTWTAPTTSAPLIQQESMWQPSVARATSSPVPLFVNPHSEPWSRTKRTAEAVTGCEVERDAMGMSMWRSSRAAPASPKNWLVERRVSKVVFRY